MTNLNHTLLAAGILLAAMVFMTVFMKNEKLANVKTAFHSLNPKFIYGIILAAVAFTAVFVRVFQFGSVPGGFNQDGAMAAVDAKALAEYGTDRFGMRYPVHLTGWGFAQMSSLMTYLMAVMIKILGFSPVVVRLPSLLVSLAGLICLFLFIREAFGEWQALIVAFFAAINPWHIMQSRWALESNMYPHFLIFGVYFLYHSLKAKRRCFFLLLSMVSFGLSMYCYGVSIYTTPFFLTIAVIYLLVSRQLRIRDAVISFFAYMFVAWPFILTMAVNTFQWDTITTPLFTIPYFAESVRSKDVLFFADHFWSQLWENLKCTYQMTIGQQKDLPWSDIEGFGTVYQFSYPFVFVGLFCAVKNCRKNPGYALSLIFLATGIFCGIITGNVNVNRINCIYYSIIILAGLGIRMLAEALPNYKHVILTTVLSCYVIVFLFFVQEYFGNYADSIRGTFYGNFHDAVNFAKTLPVEKYYITSDTQYQGSRNVSEILTLFDMEIDAEYFQGVKDIPGELPYAEKFHYFYTGEAWGNVQENAAYIITDNEIEFFDLTVYRIRQFGNYYVLYL